MTHHELTFNRSFIGFMYEQIDHQSHRWTPKQIQMDTNVNNWRNTMLNEWNTKGGWADTRNFQWYWSPDGSAVNRILVSTIEDGERYINSTWYATIPDDEVHEQYLIVFGSLDSGIDDVIGPINDREQAMAFAERIRDSDNDTWTIVPLTPVDKGLLPWQTTK